MLRARATDLAGAVLHEAAVAHGEDPAGLLAAQGLAVRWAGAQVEGEDLVLDYVVDPRRPPRRQRVSGYAVVPAEVDGIASVLLTEFAGTRADGWWGLPGGGLDPAEDPVAAVLREVWEESGQRVRVERPLAVVSERWDGPAPGGRVEDYHAVRLVYLAQCPDPGPPVVHDVGGTTADARWVPVAELPLTRVVEWAVPLLTEVTRR